VVLSQWHQFISEPASVVPAKLVLRVDLDAVAADLFAGFGGAVEAAGDGHVGSQDRQDSTRPF
jgi:hypothetical protein